MKRKKTTIVLPYDLLVKIDEAAQSLGIARSSFLSLSAAYMLARMSGIRRPIKRAAMFRELMKMFERALRPRGV